MPLSPPFRIALLATLACASQAARAAQGGSPPSPVIVQGELGAKLDDYVARCAAYGFSGSILVARGGKVLLQKGYGLADREAVIANTPDTLYDLASLSKQFTAAAVLRLEMRKKLDVDDPIAKHLPKVPDEHRGITIRHLLTHTSGMARMAPSGGGPDLVKAVADYLRAKPGAKAGARFEYWNGGYALLAAIVELRAGMPFTELCRKELFEPAGMTGTGFIGDDGLDPTRVAHGHRGERDTGPSTAHSFGWEYRGMGGVLSSVVDLYRWDRALRGDAILSEAARRELLTPALESYAFGWYVTKTPRGGRLVRHGGEVKGFTSEMLRFVDDDAVVILLADVEGIGWQVADNLGSLLFGEKMQRPAPPETVALPEADLKNLEGAYELPSKARFAVRAEPGRLVVEAEGQEAVDLLLLAADRHADSRRYEKLAGIVAAVFAGLAKNDVSPIREHMLAGLPSHWPDYVHDQYWPERLAKRGAPVSHEVLGAREEEGRVLFTVRLVQERGHGNVEIGFTGDKLSFLELHGDAGSAAVAYYAPTSRNDFASYRFAEKALAPIRFERSSDGSTERMTTELGGKKLVLVRRRDR